MEKQSAFQQSEKLGQMITHCIDGIAEDTFQHIGNVDCISQFGKNAEYHF